MKDETEILVADLGQGQVRITINRPGKHNALSRRVLSELGAAVTRCGADPATRYIVIQGAGDRYFAAGGDLVDLSAVRTPEATEQMSGDATQALDCIRLCPVPVIACLNGHAIGGGAELALACDMRMMAGHARIGYVQAKLAITPAWGGGVDLCAVVGPARALRMMSRCEMVDARTALEWGLADAVLEDGPHGTDSDMFLKPLAQHPPQVLRALKAQAAAWRSGPGYQAQRAAERQRLVATWVHDDHWKAASQVFSKAKQ
jgi:enoyl-CoA hydratase/carnithine racemase